MAVMLDRSKDSKGFTLAELLLAVAIILVLAAIAIPSVTNAQRNMHMVELDSAANQIALAAQNQMTSMKVSNTWLATAEKVTTPAREIPATITNPSDIFVMTAQQAQTLGVLPPGSIDDTVRAGNYVIEFSKSTATVCGVFYSDGRTGFFDSTTPTGTPAQAYYDAMTSSAARDLAARSAASPPIGYYAGTPAGATDTVALQHPNIWVDSEGMLCVEDANITSHPDWNTSLQVTIEKIEKVDGQEKTTAKFVIDGIQADEQSCTVALDDAGTESLELANKAVGRDPLYKLGHRDNEELNPKNVYLIDLNVLAATIGQDNVQKLKEEFAKFNVNDSIKVSAKVVAQNEMGVPAKAMAFTNWPAASAKLTVLVTAAERPTDGTDYDKNWLSLATKRNAQGFGTEFTPVTILDNKFNTPVKTPSSGTEPSVKIPIAGTSSDLTSVDRGAGAQIFSGLWVNYDEALSMDTRIGVQPGDVHAGGSGGKTRYYQVYEIWINDIRVGSFTGVEWKWEIDNHDFLVDKNNNVLQTMPELSSGNQKIYIDPLKLEATGIAQQEGYTVYVRTAPSVKDVQTFFENSMFKDMMEKDTVLSSRSTDASSTTWRMKFLQEFHASSAMALWTLKTGNVTGVSGQGFNDSDVYVYYGLTPFKPEVGDTVTSPVMWRLTNSQDSVNYTSDPYTALGQDLTDDKRFVELGKTVSRPQIGKIGSADFGIMSDTDYLYYRAFTYFDDEGKLLSNNQQWMPLVGVNLKKNESNENTKLSKGQNKSTNLLFDGWNTKSDGKGLKYSSEETVASYDPTMPFGNVKLYGQYNKVEIGFMYIEFDSKENILSYKGFLSEKGQMVSSETSWWGAPKETIEKWGYYVLVASSDTTEVLLSKPKTFTLREEKKSYTIRGVTYDLFPVYLNDDMGYSKQIVSDDQKIGKSIPVEFTLKTNNEAVLTASYRFNACFAAMISNTTVKDTKDYEKWGTAAAPFEVRCADQFPGTLQSYGGGNPQGGIQGYYVEQNSFYFTQSRDLDASFRPTWNANKGLTTGYSKFERVFTGTYDAPHQKKILNFEYWIGSYVGSSARGQGIFPNIENATIKNITLSTETGSSWDATQNATSSLGILVGMANSSTIENCKIITSGFTLTSSKSGGGGAAGALVGYAGNKTTISVSEVQGVTILCDKGEPGTPQWGNNDEFYMGGLVGILESESVVQGSWARSITLETNSTIPSSGRALLCFGGIAGKADKATITSAFVGGSESKSGAQISVFLLDEKLQQPTKLSVGTAIGYASNMQAVQGTFITANVIWLQTGGFAPVTKPIGNQ